MGTTVRLVSVIVALIAQTLSMARPARAQAVVPPATDAAWKPAAARKSDIAAERLPDAQIDVDRLVGVQLGDPRREVTHRDVDDAGHVALGVLTGFADVDHGRAVAQCLCHVVDGDLAHERGAFLRALTSPRTGTATP